MAGKRGGMDFDLGFSAFGSGSNRGRDPERPLRVLIVGDFGRAESTRGSPEVVVPAEIDRSIARMGFSVEFTWEGERGRVPIRDIEGFHPDALARSLPWMSRLLTLRKRLSDPASSKDALDEAGRLGLLPTQSEAPKTEPSPDAAPSGTDDLAGLLGRGGGSVRKDRDESAGVDIQAFIRKVVGDRSDSGVASPGASDALRAIDLRLTSMMRAALRDERFAGIESAWRAMQHLVSNAWDEESVRFEVMSVGGVEIDEMLASPSSLLHDAIRGAAEDAPGPADIVLLVEPTHGAGASVDRAARLARASAAAGATLVLSGDASMAGCPGVAVEPDPIRWTGTRAQDWYPGWAALVESEVSGTVAIAMPRWLARRPYGIWSEPIESFAFEEIEKGDRGRQAGHESMCWAGSGWLLVRLIVEAWTSDGAEMQLGAPCVVGDLPHAAWKDDDGSHAIPCAECYMPERTVEAIAALGFIPAASMKGRDAVVLGPIQNIAGGSLRGRWT